ncbi:MAG: hypothetical protein ACK5Z5_02110 [Neisseriaceae bacterium]
MKQKRILILGSLLFITNVFADGSGFQAFQNEYNLGYQFTQMTLINGDQSTAQANQQAINLEVEHLFDIGIWADASLNMVTNYSQPTLGPDYKNGGSGGQPNSQAYAFGQNPFMYSILLKGGYAFSLLDDKMQIIPYVMFGRNANWAASTIVANGYENVATIDSFLTGGVGLRLSYRFGENLMLYADQLYNYNWDQSGAIKTIQTTEYGKSYAATNYELTTTIGAKYNVTKDFQIGLSGFWNNYQHQSNISGTVYIPQNTFGEMLTVGLTY